MDQEIDEGQKQFLLTLYDCLNGSTSKQMSMYDVGASIGCEKPETLKIAESFMGMDLVEIRTLSGGIGFTEAGLEAARKLGAGNEAGDISRLGNGPVIEDAGRDGVEAVTTALKAAAGGFGLPFDALTELVADLRTVDAQMTSSRPKTAILRECFTSMQKTLAKVNSAEHVTQINHLLA